MAQGLAAGGAHGACRQLGNALCYGWVLWRLCIAQQYKFLGIALALKAHHFLLGRKPQGITQAQESQEGRLQELTVQLAGLAPLPASAAAVQAQVECLSQQQEQHAASVAAASARLEGQLAQQGKTLVALAEQVGTPQEQATQPVLAAVEQRIASLELSSQNVESAAAAAAEQLAGQLASTQQQLADAQRAAVERAAAAGASLQELSAQVDALAQAQAPAEAVEALQRGLRDVQLGLELCCGSFAQTKQGLESRVGRLEAAVAGAGFCRAS